MSTDRVIICPKGLFLISWDSRARRERQRLARPEALITCWTVPAEVENATIGDFLHIIAALNAKNLRVLECVAGSSIGAYLKEAMRPSTGASDITVMEIGKDVSIEKDFMPPKGGNRVEVQYDVNARKGPSGRPRGGWALGPTPLNEIAGARLVLQREGKVHDSRRHPPKVIAKFRAEYTLGEIITALLFDLCFDGSPETRDRRWKEMGETLERVKNGARTYSLEEVRAECDARHKREAPKLARIEEQMKRERHQGDK